MLLKIWNVLSAIHSCTLVPRPPPGTELSFVVHRKCASARGRGGYGPHRPVSEVNLNSPSSGLAILALGWAQASTC